MASKPWLDMDGKWLQSKFESRHKPSDVISGDEAEQIKQRMDTVHIRKKNITNLFGLIKEKNPEASISHQIKAAVFEDGLYESEFDTLRDRVTDRIIAGEEGYAELMKQERAKMNEERNKR